MFNLAQVPSQTRHTLPEELHVIVMPTVNELTLDGVENESPLQLAQVVDTGAGTSIMADTAMVEHALATRPREQRLAQAAGTTILNTLTSQQSRSLGAPRQNHRGETMRMASPAVTAPSPRQSSPGFTVLPTTQNDPFVFGPEGRSQHF